VKEHDAIWHFVFKMRGNSTKRTFKPEEVRLAVVMEYEDYRIGEENNTKHETGNASTRRCVSDQSDTHYCNSLLMFLIAYSLVDRRPGNHLTCG